MLEVSAPHSSATNRFQAAQHGIVELGHLINQSSFLDGLIAVQSYANTKLIKEIQLSAEELVFRLKIQSLRESGDLAPISVLKKKAREMQQLGFASNVYNLSIPAEAAALTMEVLKQNPKLKSGLELMQSQSAATEAQTTKKVETLRQELIQSANEPSLLNALELWGQSRNARGETNSGKGYHAGVVHYFEYRSRHDKSHRFDQAATEAFSIADFIKLSESFRPILRPEHTKDCLPIEKGILLEDRLGQQRLVALTDQYLIVAFKKSDQPLRLLTYIPSRLIWYKTESLRARMTKILETENDRFNSLDSDRRVVKTFGF